MQFVIWYQISSFNSQSALWEGMAVHKTGRMWYSFTSETGRCTIFPDFGKNKVHRPSLENIPRLHILGNTLIKTAEKLVFWYQNNALINSFGEIGFCHWKLMPTSYHYRSLHWSRSSYVSPSEENKRNILWKIFPNRGKWQKMGSIHKTMALKALHWTNWDMYKKTWSYYKSYVPVCPDTRI